MPAFEIKKRKLWIFEHYQFEYLLGLFDDHLGDVIDAALPNYSLRSLTTCVMDNTISVIQKSKELYFAQMPLSNLPIT